jgi:transposase-like protein
MYCPACGSNNCIRSRRRGTKEHMLSWFGIVPFRCHDCKHRFSIFYPKFRSDEPDRPR